MTTSFATLGVPADIVTQLDADGITVPFPVQSLTLPDALGGLDVCGRAPTGSGKTLAFAVPLATRTDRAGPHRPRALVLLPTRELAAQVCHELRPLAALRHRRAATFYGGTSIRRDQQRLARGVDIAVATPGRLADLVARGDCDLRDVELVVVDEADRLADMGFLPEVKRLLDRTAPTRQTLLFSATLDGDVDELVRRYQTSPARHEVAADDDTAVRHMFWPAERGDRVRLTADIVRQVAPAIVFTRTKHGADRLARQLAVDGIRTAAIHGNRSQRQRERALAGFAGGSVSTLVATDVAARGIHVDAVGVVVHFDLPGTHKDYVHRSGRTGRAGATGLVVSLVAEEERRSADTLQRALDLPRGLHRADSALLTADELPAPAPFEPASRGRTRPGGGRHAAAKAGGKAGRATPKAGGKAGRSAAKAGGKAGRSAAKGGAKDARTTAQAGSKAARSGAKRRSGARRAAPRHDRRQ